MICVILFSMLTVLSKVIVIFAVIGIGFFCNRKNILPSSAEPAMVDLLILIICPCMVMSSLFSRTLDQDTLPKTFLVLGLSAAHFAFAAIISYIIATKFMKNTPKKDLGVLMAVMTSVNSGFMGFPMTKAIFGDDIFFLIVIQNIILNIYFYSLAIIQINYGGGESGSILSSLKSIINPNIIAAAIGLIVLFGRIGVPEPLKELIDMLGGVTTPLSMLIVGMRLSNSSLKSVFKNRDLILTSVVNMIIMPLLVFLAVNWLPISSDVKLLMVWATCFPCAVMVVSLSSKYGRNATLAAEGMALTTAMSLVLLPIAATLLSAIYGF